MSETSQPPPSAEPVKSPAPPAPPALTKEPPKLSGAELKKQKQAEKAARRAQEKQGKQGAGPAAIVNNHPIFQLVTLLTFQGSLSSTSTSTKARTTKVRPA